MRRRDWLKSLAVLAAVPMIGVRKAVASAEAVPETLPAVAPPPSVEPVAEPSPRVWPPEAIWINGEPGDEVMVFGGPKGGKVLDLPIGSRRFDFPVRRPHGGYEWCQYSRERIVLSTPNVRIFLDVWCYCGTGYSLRPTPESKATALKWALKNYGHLIRDPDVSADEIRSIA